MARNKLNQPTQFPTPTVDGIARAVADELSGIVALKPMAKYLSGARCVIKINGKIVGFAFEVSWNIQTIVNEIRAIDNYLPEELAPSIVSVTGSIGCFRIPGASPTAPNKMSGGMLGVLGIGQFAGKDYPMQSTVANFMGQPYITIEVRDSQSDNIIFYTSKAMITSRVESIRFEDLAKMTLEFRAIGWRDERDPMDPNEDNVSGLASAASAAISAIR